MHGGRKTNVTLISFLCLFTETITPERKNFFSNKQNLGNPLGIANIPFCDALQKYEPCYFLLKYEPRIEDKGEVYDKEQKIHRNFFYIYVLKELSPKLFHKFLTKENS